MEEEAELNAWVMNRAECLLSDGTRYSLPSDFYTKLGFPILSEHRLEAPNCSAVRIQLKQAESSCSPEILSSLSKGLGPTSIGARSFIPAA